ncbi:MAG: acyl-CoA dehydrogenase family protein [Woeseiaceae bacterium]
MDFSLSEEQAMLADSIGRFINTSYDFETRQKIAAGDGGFSLEMWRNFAELGWTAVPFAEEDGGLDGGPIELMLMMEQFGRGLVVEPFLANIVLAGGVLRRTAEAGQKAKWVAPLIAGELQAAFAVIEPQSRFDVANTISTAEANGEGYVVNGAKSLVLNGGAAELLIVPARTSGDQLDQRGISLFAVPADTRGIDRTTYATVDGLQAAEIVLSDVQVAADSVLGEIDNAFETIAAVIDEATLAVSAEALGIMQIMHDKTVEYSKNRVQFGVPIGSFQALQHRMVDNLMACEQSRSLLYWCVMLNLSDDPQFRSAVSALKYQVGTAGVKVAEEAVQLHGGMGVTWELDIAHFLKRMTAINIMFGNADFHLDRYIDVSATSSAQS